MKTSHALLGAGALLGVAWLASDASAAAPAPVGDQGPIVPRRSSPTLTTKTDVADYLSYLSGQLNSFSQNDVIHNMVSMDPDVEAAQVEDYCRAAQTFDGCEQCLSCPGWQESEAAPSSFDIAATTARALRQKAFQHRINQRWMEDLIDARQLKKAQWQAEVAYVAEYQAFLGRVAAFRASVDVALLVKESDFQQVQHFDTEYQQFRRRYTAMTGLAPTTPLGTILPPEPNPYLTALTIGVVGVAVIAGASLAKKLVRERTAAAPSAEEPLPHLSPSPA